MALCPVKWEPPALTFPVALNKPAVQELRATNTSDAAYSFKVKTTNPKRYSVRPNVGIVLGHQEAKVTVQLPGLREVPSDMNKCKDKFQVLTLKLDETKLAQLQAMGAGSQAQRDALTDLWASDGAKEANVDKIKCAFAFDSSYRDPPIPEEDPTLAPYSPETVPGGNAPGAGMPPQTPYADAANAEEEDDEPPAAQPTSAPSTPQRGGGGSSVNDQLSSANAELGAARAAAAKAESEVAGLEAELSKQRKLTAALEARAKAGGGSSKGLNQPPSDASKAGGGGFGTLTVLFLILAAFGAGLGVGGMGGARPLASGGGGKASSSYYAPTQARRGKDADEL